MTKVMMSSEQAAGNLWRRGVGTIPQWELAAQAIREAERVLAEAEPVTRFGWRMSLSDLRHITRLDVGDAKQSFETDSGRDALASAIAAILPVLDELESAVPVNSVGGLLVGIWSRNLATNAALEAR